MDGDAVRAFYGIEAEVITTDPVVFSASRVCADIDILAVVPFALAGKTIASDLVRRQVRHVDVQQAIRRKPRGLDLRCQHGREFGGRLEMVGRGERDQRNGNGRNA